MTMSWKEPQALLQPNSIKKQTSFAMMNTQALEKSPVTADPDFLPSKASFPTLKLR